MPRLSSRGDLVAGVGGATVSIWRRSDATPTAIATNAGGADWLDDDISIYQQDAHLDTFDLRTAEIALIDEQGSFELAAGGGVYAAKFFDGVRISNQPGTRLVGYGVGDVAPDGSVLLKTPDGRFQGRLIEDIQSHGGSSWSGLEWRRPVSSPDLPVAQVVEGSIYGFRRFGSFCCYLAEQGARFIVQHLDRPVGKVLAVTLNAFRPDLVLTPDGVLVVTYAEQEDEPPHLIRRFLVAVSELTEDLTVQTPVQSPPKIVVESYDALMKAGAPWLLDFTNTGTRFQVTKDVQDRLWIEASNAAGHDRTGRVRQLTVEGPSTPPPEIPPMHSDIRFWCGPNIGSIDMVNIFDDPATLTAFGAFGLFTQNILNLGTAIGPNTFEALQANEAFKKLKDAGVPLVIEGGTLSDLDVVQKIRDVQGEVTYFSYSEPLTYPQGLPYAIVLDKTVTFIQKAASMGVQTGWLEAWPAVDMATQIRFLTDLVARGAKPAYWHLDIDWNRSGNDAKTASAIKQARAAADAAGVTFGCFVNSTKDPIPTDVQHHANLIALAQKIHGIIPVLPQVHVAAWAQRVKDGPQDVPKNFGVYGLLRTFDEVRAIFEATQVPPIEEHNTMKFAKLIDGDPLAVKKAVPSSRGGFSILVLPDFMGNIDPTDPAHAHDPDVLCHDYVFSMQPGGRPGYRKPGADGLYEQGSVQSGLASYSPDGQFYTQKFVTVGE